MRQSSRILTPWAKVLLAGGGEFGANMEAPDRRSIARAGGFEARICIVPTAAVPDNNHERAGNNGRRWFRHLGARNVGVVPLIDRRSAAHGAVTDALRNADLLYLLGGFPGYLAGCLAGTPAWEAILAAVRTGALIAGSSAGAMVLCGHYFDPARARISVGLGLLPQCCVLPHHNRFGHRWASQLQRQIPEAILIGIDEETGVLTAAEPGQWQVHGAGKVTLYRDGKIERYESGAVLRMV